MRAGSLTPKTAMVRWYHPSQLVKTGINVAVSTIFGRNSDYRLLEALRTPLTCEFYDHSVECVITTQNGREEVMNRPEQKRSEIWIDYVADTGDGWHSTYSVALNVAQDLQLDAPDHTSTSTRRGQLLILGGDEVYPVASRSNYKRKLV